jgi:hypothetical protein
VATAAVIPTQLALMMSTQKPKGSVLTTYSDDDPVVWKELRHGLILDGFKSPAIQEHLENIKGYVRELSDQGVLDIDKSTGVKFTPAGYRRPREVAARTKRIAERFKSNITQRLSRRPASLV